VLSVKHPKECVLCPAEDHGTFPSSQMSTEIHRIIESLRFEKTSKIIKSNCQPIKEKIVWGQMQSLAWHCVL